MATLLVTSELRNLGYGAVPFLPSHRAPSSRNIAFYPCISAAAADGSSRCFFSSCPPSTLNPRAIGPLRCRALGERSQTVYQGIYSPWTVEPSDVREVILYRCGLVTAASSFIIAASTAFLPEDNFLVEFIKQDIDLLYAVGASGLGLSLILIHIYVSPIKRFLQALWAVGVLGSVWTYISLAQPQEESLIHYIINNPFAVWFVGPLFAALTGLVFKEGLCYGKLEAGILTFIIPALLLGHMTGLMDNGAKLGLLGLWMALFVLFAARKFQQPIKDDIGDKSVFMYNALPEKEKKALLQKLEIQKDEKQLD